MVNSSSLQQAPTPRRKFNVLLALGITFLPFVFVWFLLRRGHSTTARIIGFLWTAVLVVAIIAAPPPEISAASSGANSTSVVQDQSPRAHEAREAAEKERQRRRDLERAPERFLQLEQHNGVRGGFDTVFLLSGTIRNTSDVDIKDPTITCSLYGASGTEIGEVRETLLEIVPAAGTRRFSELNMGFMGSTQVARYTCEIVDAEAMP